MKRYYANIRVEIVASSEEEAVVLCGELIEKIGGLSMVDSSHLNDLITQSGFNRKQLIPRGEFNN